MNELKDKDPARQIEAGNRWYLDDQFAIQLGDKGTRFAIENRWRIFEESIKRHFEKRRVYYQKKGIKVLDAGSGDGINLLGLTHVMKKNNWSGELCGVDYNPLRIERAGKIPGVSSVIKANLCDLPYSDEAFDVVVCNHVLEHIPEHKKVLKEIKRVIVKGGLFILGVPNEGCFLAQLRNRYIQPSNSKMTDHVHFYTEKQINEMLKELDFKIEKVEKEGFFFPHLRLLMFIRNYPSGRKLIHFMSKCFPGQAAGLIISSEKKACKD